MISPTIISYICEGCLGILSLLKNITTQGTSVALPYISELKKLPVLTKAGKTEPPTNNISAYFK